MQDGEGWRTLTDTEKNQATARAYWKANIRLLVVLMAIWFLVSFGAGILFRPFLDQFHIGGFPLGFWFAQQGSIYVFIALVFIYTRKMKKLDHDFDVDD